MFSMALSGCMPKGGLSDQIEFTRLDPGGTYSYRDPVWSPDSSKIAYTRFEVYDHPRAEKITTGEIFVMDVTTRQTTQLTHNGLYEFEPTWSPDGQSIAYVREGAIYGAQIQDDVITDSLRITNSDGSGDREVFVCPFSCGTPSWSPAGDRIAFHMAAAKFTPDLYDTEPPIEIHVVNVDGTGLTRLTQGVNHARRPRWSPDGSKIIFQRSEKNQIRVIDLQSGVETAFDLKDIKGAGEPAWSPDQSGIVFSANQPDEGVQWLYFLNLADGAIKPLFSTEIGRADLPSDMNEPDWSPDGSKIVFSVYRSQLYLADLSVLKSR
jgi:Tol biopolymer transport system component